MRSRSPGWMPRNYSSNATSVGRGCERARQFVDRSVARGFRAALFERGPKAGGHLLRRAAPPP
eukprot:8210710-Lingulodinium_polyedra.AAC.1